MKNISADKVRVNIKTLRASILSEEQNIKEDIRIINDNVLIKLQIPDNLDKDNENMLRIAKKQQAVINNIEEGIVLTDKMYTVCKSSIQNSTESIMLSINRLKKEAEEF